MRKPTPDTQGDCSLYWRAMGELGVIFVTAKVYAFETV
jgi:hypothetical protein